MILCAVDGSRHAQIALDMVRYALAHPGEPVLLAHVVDVRRFRPPKGADRAARQAVADALFAAERHGRALLARVKTPLVLEGLPVETKAVRGVPADALTSIAARRRPDLFVVGSRGLSDAKRFLLGSVSRHVVLAAACPVLVVKKRVPAFRRILVAADGSKASRAALACLLRLPLPKLARFTVVSVVPPLPIEAGHGDVDAALLERVLAPLRQEAERVAREAAAVIDRAGFEATPLVRHGHPAQELVKLAEAKDADLVAVGSRGLTGSDRLALGSVSDGVVKYAPCAVLVVRK